MRHDPLFTLWRIDCPSPEECRRLQQWLAGEVGSDRVIVDEVRAVPGGVETVSLEPHRLGDYFESVRVLPSAGQTPMSFRLLFHRRQDAGRFWKDVMVRILQKVREADQTTTALEYRGDEAPEGLAATGGGKLAGHHQETPVPHPFFATKRPWSKQKDLILQHYLTPYIPKVTSLGRPVLIVDCFAGCGAFSDGQPGSPLIIADVIRRFRDAGTNVTGEFIEADADNFKALSAAMAPYSDFATCRHSTFEEYLLEIERRARTDSVFLYVDPYTVKGLTFSRMRRVYDQIRSAGSSVEVLMNFNVAIFMRWGLAAMRKRPEPAEAVVDGEDGTDDPSEPVELETLDGIAGGTYWREIADNDRLTFPDKLAAFGEKYLDQMGQSFRYACYHEVKARYGHQVPKYLLVFGTRHPDGVELMNDAMHKAGRQALDSQFVSGMLFDMTPEDEIVDLAPLKEALVRAAGEAGPMARKALRFRMICDFFGRYAVKHHNQAVGELLKAKRLFSRNGKTRVNDAVLIGATPFPEAGE